MQVNVSTTEYFNYRATDGRIVVAARVDRHWDGASITVAHSDTLGRQYPAGTEGELDTYLAWLEEVAAADGITLRLIEDAAGALTSAAAVFDDAERDLIASINATLDVQPATVDVSDILADIETARQARTDRELAAANNVNLDGYRQATTRTGKPVSDPMDRILTSAVDGYIPRSKNAKSNQLIALERRGKVVCHWKRDGRTRYIAGAWVAGRKPSEVAA